MVQREIRTTKEDAPKPRNVTTVDTPDGTNIIVAHRFGVLVAKEQAGDILWLIAKAIEHSGDEETWNG